MDILPKYCITHRRWDNSIIGSYHHTMNEMYSQLKNADSESEYNNILRNNDKIMTRPLFRGACLGYTVRRILDEHTFYKRFYRERDWKIYNELKIFYKSYHQRISKISSELK